MRAWLSESDLLDEPLSAGISIESLSAEVFLVEVRRSWLDPQVFKSRSWKWDEQPLSDGGNPPQGILPAYVVGVVFARNLVIELDTKAIPGNSSPASKSLTVANRAIVRRLRAFKPNIVSVRPFTLANRQRVRHLPASRTPVVSARLPICRGTPASAIQGTGSGAVAAIDGPDGSVHAFPVPPSFRCDPIIDKASQLLQKAESELRDLNQRRLTPRQQINQLEQQVKQTLGQLKVLERYGNAEKVTIRDQRGGATTTRVIHVKEERNKFNQELSRLQRDLADQSAKRTAEDRQVKEQSDLVEELK